MGENLPALQMLQRETGRKCLSFMIGHDFLVLSKQ
jgi:hypothetical protein